MNRNFEGKWNKKFNNGKDSNLQHVARNNSLPYNHINVVKLGEVISVENEPDYPQTMIVARLSNGGVFQGVGWPGPNLLIGPTGKPDVSGGMHGLYEGPFPGQQILLGFPEGNGFNPIVIQKFPYNPNGNFKYKDTYQLPMTKKKHDSRDVILGHYSGSFISLRSGSDSGSIEIECKKCFHLSSTNEISLISKTGEIDLSCKESKRGINISQTIKIGSREANEAVLKGTTALTEMNKDVTVMNLLISALKAWIPVPSDGGAALKTSLAPVFNLQMADYSNILSTKVFVE